MSEGGYMMSNVDGRAHTLHSALHRYLIARTIVTIALFAILCAFAMASALIGPIKLSLVDILRAVRDMILAPSQLTEMQRIIVYFRLPRIALAVLVGSALATSGVGLQALFRNPMADPYLLGISAGGALGAAIITALGITASWLGLGAMPIAAFVGALCAAWLVATLGRVGGVLRTDTVLLAGIALNALLSALVSLIMYLSAHRLALTAIYFWMLGGFYSATWRHVSLMLPHAVVGIALLWIYAQPLNALLLGEESAHYVGVDVARLKWIVLATVAWSCSGAVAYAGAIGFVGLIVPHITRLLIGPDHRFLMPDAALFGAIFLVGCDMLSRLGQEVPVGIFTALAGVPFFLFLLRRAQRVYI